MTYLYLFSLIALISCTVGLHVNNPASPAEGKILHYKDIDKYFNPENITVAYSTDYVSNLNITAVSPDNNPEDYLLLFYNVSQNVSIPGLLEFGIGLQVSSGESPYDTSNFERKYSLNVGTDFKELGVTLNVSLGVGESLYRKVDFSNFDVRSRIEYNVTIISEANITWSTDAAKNINDIVNLPLYKVDPASHLSEWNAWTPLVNATGHDDTSCNNENCVTSITRQRDMDNYYLFDDITVINSREVTSWVASTIYDNGSNSTYSVVSVIEIDYIVIIGEHRC